MPIILHSILQPATIFKTIVADKKTSQDLNHTQHIRLQIKIWNYVEKFKNLLSYIFDIHVNFILK